MLPERGFFLSVLAAFVLVAVPAAAQQGVIDGRVTDAGTGQALPGVQVSVQDMSTGSLTDQGGRFSISLPAGSYTVVVEMIGYATQRVDGLSVVAGQTVSVNTALVWSAIALDPIQVTVGRRTQKATEAPATVAIVSQVKIQERVTASPIDHMKDVVGVDIINYGVSAGNVVVRGFNNIFSGAVHFLTDHRIASVPSLQVNLMQFVPSMDEDIARMEVVLGPGAALYGPNTANGVVHLITRSPLEVANTTISMASGQRSTLKGAVRTSQKIGENFGIKVSGSYFRGDEWRYTDPVEVQAIEAATADPEGFERSFGLAPGEIDRVGKRDFDIERWGGEARADWRFSDNGTAIVQMGRSTNDGIELTGIGAGQTKDWVYTYYQARLNQGRLFAQGYLNTSDAGDSFLLRRGARLVDRSKMWVAQLQHGRALAEDRIDLIYGLDYRKTNPESEGTIYGRYEDEDESTEFGAYAQAELLLNERWKALGALRFDKTSVLEDPVWSPRAALLFTPVPQQSFRLTYNRAFSTPTSLNMFLDINGGRAPGLLGDLGYLSRATGSGENGLSFQDADGTFRGMRSPFSGAPNQVQQVTAQNLWSNAVNFLVARGAIPAQAAPVWRSFNASQVGINVFDPLNPTDIKAMD